MTPDEALAAARLALPFVQAGKRSMGPEHGLRNPSYVLAEAFAALDELAGWGHLPEAWKDPHS